MLESEARDAQAPTWLTCMSPHIVNPQTILAKSTQGGCQHVKNRVGRATGGTGGSSDLGEHGGEGEKIAEKEQEEAEDNFGTAQENDSSGGEDA